MKRLACTFLILLSTLLAFAQEAPIPGRRVNGDSMNFLLRYGYTTNAQGEWLDLAEGIRPTVAIKFFRMEKSAADGDWFDILFLAQSDGEIYTLWSGNVYTKASNFYCTDNYICIVYPTNSGDAFVIQMWKMSSPEDKGHAVQLTRVNGADQSKEIFFQYTIPAANWEDGMDEFVANNMYSDKYISTFDLFKSRLQSFTWSNSE